MRGNLALIQSRIARGRIQYLQSPIAGISARIREKWLDLRCNVKIEIVTKNAFSGATDAFAIYNEITGM